MQITTNTSITINFNGKDYTFSTPHDIEDLINRLQAEQDNLVLWQQRATDSQNLIADINGQIAALCVNPV